MQGFVQVYTGNGKGKTTAAIGLAIRAAGAGLKIKTPIGPAGIEIARPIFDEETSWQLHFNIGHTF